MSSIATTVLADVVAALRASTSLAGRADNVVVGALDLEAETPKVAVNPIGVQGANEDQLGAYRRTLTLSIMAAVGATTPTSEARVIAALEMLDELVGALETSIRSLSSTTGHGLDILCVGESFDGANVYEVDVGIVVIEASIWWIAPSGSGT